MKIAISSTGKDLKANVAEVFGRCPYFQIVNIENGKVKESLTIENVSAGQSGGAGVSAARMVAEKDVNAVIAGSIGPRASEVLRQFNVVIYKGIGPVEKVVREFSEGKFEKI